MDNETGRRGRDAHVESRPPSGERRLLIVRVDGSRVSAGPGIGHAMRCLALAGAWAARGGEVVVVTRELPLAVVSRYRQLGAEVSRSGGTGRPGGVSDAVTVAEEAARRGAAWVVADGYRFGTRFQREVSARARLLVIDDHGEIGEYHAAMILDQNPGASAATYERRPSACTLLLGSRFALVDAQLAARARHLRTGTARVILFLLGGGPSPAWLSTVRVAARLVADAGYETRVVGARPPAGAGPVSWLGFRRDVADQLAQADLCVAAAGSVSGEICCSGVPALLTSLVENQAIVAQAMEHAGAAIDLGPSTQLTAQAVANAVVRLASDGGQRTSLSTKGMQLIDGRGAERVVDAMWPRLRLRGAEPGDVRTLWRWANDPATRQASFSAAPIPWEEHRAWFTQRLASPTCLHLIGIGETGQAVGQVRFEKAPTGGVADVHFSVDAGRRGAGLGSALLCLGTAEAFATWRGTDEVVGRVKVSNPASMRAFAAAGFRRGTQSRGGEVASWSRRREDPDVRR
jgi:UDP-2,4-diacetamido-2,4,6-trideoxy-beta-L-altropyranose hydrolase